MTLKDYFESATGIGVLATTDAGGNCNAAIYARPHVMENGDIAFIMTDRLTHANLQSNPKAVYLFKESGEGYRGKRLYLTKAKEEKDSPLIPAIRRRKYGRAPYEDDRASRFLVFFRLDRTRPLIGDSE